MRINKNSVFPKDFFSTPSKPSNKYNQQMMPKLLSSYSQSKFKKEKQGLPKASSRHFRDIINTVDSPIEEEMNFTFGKITLEIPKTRSFANLQKVSIKKDKAIAR